MLDIYTFETSCGTRKRNKKHPQDSNSPTYFSSNDGKKNRKKQKRNADSNQRHRCKEQTCGLSGRRQVWDDLRERIALKHVH